MDKPWSSAYNKGKKAGFLEQAPSDYNLFEKADWEEGRRDAREQQFNPTGAPKPSIFDGMSLGTLKAIGRVQFILGAVLLGALAAAAAGQGHRLQVFGWVMGGLVALVTVVLLLKSVLKYAQNRLPTWQFYGLVGATGIALYYLLKLVAKVV